MKRMKWWMGLPVCLLLLAVAMILPSFAADSPGIEVGHVYYIEGDLLRYVPDQNDWVAVVKDTPFSAEDVFFSGNQGMAELIVPNGSWIRTGNSTQIQFIALDTDLSEVDVASGVARFYNKSSRTLIKATSPFGYVLAYPGTVFDFYVGENSVEVVAVQGTATFVHAATNARYDVAAGSPSILADRERVSSGEGIVDPDWDQWNRGRESFWVAKSRVRGRSVDYLPPSLQDEAYVLEENGTWESVPYEGTNCWFWRPIRVGIGWSPFTVGRWTDWYGDQTWIPAEPFGYVTHHYGNWIHTRNRWYWAPPVASVRVGLPLLNVGFFWYPGRVSWIHRGAYVGWVPLAPRETYYSHHRWGGPHDVVVANVTQINISVRNYAYANRAIIVDQKNFYGTNNYRNVRVTNVNPTTIINTYRAAPVVNNTVINNYTTNKQRYNYTNATAREKPHNTVVNRIQQNETNIQRGRKETATELEQQVKTIREGRVNREVRIEQPKSTNYIVPANEVNRPKSEIRLQQREIKGVGRGAPPPQPAQPPTRPERVAPVRPIPQQPGVTGRPEPQPRAPEQARPERVVPVPAPRPQPAQPAARPPQVAPEKPTQPAQPPTRPERVAPVRPIPQQPGVTGRPEPQPRAPEQARPERVVPVRPVSPTQSAQPEQTPSKPPQVVPEKPTQPIQPPAKTERVAPVRPIPQQPGVTGRPEPQPRAPEQARPERVVPVPAPRPQPAQPAARPPQVAPEKPTQPTQPPTRPERVAPVRPEQPPEQAAPAKPSEKDAPPAKTERAVPEKSGQQERSRNEPGQQERLR